MEPVRLPFLLRMLQNCELPHKLGACERLFGRRLSQKGVCWVSTAAGIPWKLDLGNATHRWIVYGKYEGAPFLDWAKRFLPADGVVVDSGANIGQMLLYLAQWVPNGKVLAIEPGKNQIGWLEECLHANPKLPVELIEVGLGDAHQNAYLEETGPPDRHGSWNRVSNERGEAIKIAPLSDLLTERGIKCVDLWKLDVEGFEIPALRGAGKWIAEKRIRAIYVELDGQNGRAINDYLNSRGYRLHLFHRKGKLRRAEQIPDHTNGLFFPAR